MAEKQFTETLKYVEKVLAVISNEDGKKRIEHLIESIRNADGLDIDKADENRRITYLNLNALALAQQATWLAFQGGDLTDNLENEFRALPSAEEAQAAAKEAEDAVKAEEDAISKQIAAFRERAKKYDLIRAVCNGRSVKEAKKMQDEYEKQASQLKG